MDSLLLLLIFVAPAASDLILQQTGKDVTLSCQVDGGVSIRAVKWIIYDLETPGYVLSYSDGRSDPTNQHPSFKGRVQLVNPELKNGDVSLILKNVSVNDSGVYECRVADGGSGRNERNETVIRTIILMVKDSVVFVRRTQRGKDVTLSCQVDGGVSIRAVKWTRRDLKTPGYVFSYSNGRSDPTNQHPSFKGRVQLVNRQLKNGNVSLILRNVRVSDTGMYECRVADGGSGLNKTGETLIRRIQLEVSVSGVAGGGSKKIIPAAGNPGRSWKIALKAVGALIVGAAAAVAWRCKRRRAGRSEERAADETVGHQVI